MIPDSYENSHRYTDTELKKEGTFIFDSLVTDAFDTLLLFYMYVDLKIIKVIIVWKLFPRVFTDVKKQKKNTIKLHKSR